MSVASHRAHSRPIEHLSVSSVNYPDPTPCLATAAHHELKIWKWRAGEYFDVNIELVDVLTATVPARLIN